LTERRRGFIDRLTNRDIIADQSRKIESQGKSLNALHEANAERKKIDDAITSEGPDFLRPGLESGTHRVFGKKIDNIDRFWASTREPVGGYVVNKVAVDIWDNWFAVDDAKKEKPDEDLDNRVQSLLTILNAKSVFTRATIFERRYGTSIILVAYADGKLPLNEPVPEDTPGITIEQIEPYPLTKFSVKTADIVNVENIKKEEEPANRLGLPRYYSVNMGSDNLAKVKVHWSRVIHCAPRLDEHKFWGVSVIDIIHDDLTVYRNERWGLGQTLFRFGSGFPVITLTGASDEKVKAYQDAGTFANICSMTYFVCTDKQSLEFKGVAGAALNPAPYIEPVLDNLSIGTGIPKAMLRGAQAGALAGSETNRYEYSMKIGSEQLLVEPEPRELINRLLGTGQLVFEGNYVIDWGSAFELSEKDKAVIERDLAIARRSKSMYKMVDEIRDEEKLLPLPGGAGQVVLELEKITAGPGGMGMFSSAGKKDTAMNPPVLSMATLEEELLVLRGKIDRDDLDLNESREEARTIVNKHVNVAETIALDRLAEITGVRVDETSPEGMKLRKEMVDYYMTWFDKLLKDIIKHREVGEVAVGS